MIQERGCLPEEDARSIMLRLLDAVRLLHSKNIIHRDLKLGNLLLASKDDVTRIKVADFGLARRVLKAQEPLDEDGLCGFQPDDDLAAERNLSATMLRDKYLPGRSQSIAGGPMARVPVYNLTSRVSVRKSKTQSNLRSSRGVAAISEDFEAEVASVLASFMRKDGGNHTRICGTTPNLAPEIVTAACQKNGTTAGYGPPSDMWAVGVILFTLLSGYPPFGSDGEDETKIMAAIRLGSFDFADPIWHLVSNESKDLICRLLCIRPKLRLTAEEALRHPWCLERNLESQALEKASTMLGGGLERETVYDFPSCFQLLDTISRT